MGERTNPGDDSRRRGGEFISNIRTLAQEKRFIQTFDLETANKHVRRTEYGLYRLGISLRVLSRDQDLTLASTLDEVRDSLRVPTSTMHSFGDLGLQQAAKSAYYGDEVTEEKPLPEALNYDIADILWNLMRELQIKNNEAQQGVSIHSESPFKYIGTLHRQGLVRIRVVNSVDDDGNISEKLVAHFPLVLPSGSGVLGCYAEGDREIKGTHAWEEECADIKAIETNPKVKS